MEEKKALISFCKADIAGGDNVVIYDLDMEVYPGDFVYIVGKVGSRKQVGGRKGRSLRIRPYGYQGQGHPLP